MYATITSDRSLYHGHTHIRLSYRGQDLGVSAPNGDEVLLWLQTRTSLERGSQSWAARLEVTQEVLDWLGEAFNVPISRTWIREQALKQSIERAAALEKAEAGLLREWRQGLDRQSEVEEAVREMIKDARADRPWRTPTEHAERLDEILCEVAGKYPTRSERFARQQAEDRALLPEFPSSHGGRVLVPSPRPGESSLILTGRSDHGPSASPVSEWFVRLDGKGRAIHGDRTNTERRIIRWLKEGVLDA